MYAVGAALSLADCALALALFYVTDYTEEYFGAGDALDHWPKTQTLLAAHLCQPARGPGACRTIAGPDRRLDRRDCVDFAVSFVQ